ncbi:hypothetical protein, partial [Cloacibacillus porcorum]
RATLLPSAAKSRRPTPPSEREAVRAKSKERLNRYLSFLAYHLWSGAFVSGFRTLSFDFFQ